jgi:hypothetical protein
MSTYAGPSTAAAAQAELERHLAAGGAGRCRGCGEAWPCNGWVLGHAAFGRLGVLPRRVPGRTWALVARF